MTPTFFENMDWTISFIIRLTLFTFAFQIVFSKKFEGEKPAWAKKDIRDYSDADLERLYDQWEVCKYAEV